MPATFTADSFQWDYTADSVCEFSLPGVPSVYFNGERIRTRNWLDTKHADGAMHEPMFSFTLARLIEVLDPRTYFDIGGYVGYFTILPLAWLDPSARVFCFEMNQRFCVLIRSSLDFNTHLSTSRVFVQNAGISDEVALAREMYVQGFELAEQGPDGETNAHVDVLTLDYIHETMGIAPDLIKMDIEGFEAPALRGASGLLRTHGPTILFELHSDGFLEPHDASRESVIAGLEELGYRLFAVTGTRHSSIEDDRPLVPVTPANRSQYVSMVNSSFVALPAQRASTLVELCRSP